jgi:phage protein D
LPDGFQILMGGTPVADDFYDKIGFLEAEESADLPGAFQLQLAVSRSDSGEVSPTDQAGLQPLAPIAIIATAGDGGPECIFDGYVLAHKLHLETGLTNASLTVTAQDASWLMDLEEKTREWADVTDGTVANNIFGEYGFATAPANTSDDSPAHVADAHSLMQRGTDLQFLRMLARRAGKLCRVRSGIAALQRTGIFAAPAVDGPSVVTLRPNDATAPNIAALDLEWDVLRPSAVVARQALFTDPSPEGAAGDAAASGITAMDARDLASFAGKKVTAMLTTAVDDSGELRQRAVGLLRDAGWFVRVTGEANAAALQIVLRVGQIVTIEAIGTIHSGRYLVWNVRHRIDAEAHKMTFVLVRNAVGPAPSGGSGGLLGGLL